jgi:RNA polymerase sigma-70 factor (ECF subfamily)
MDSPSEQAPLSEMQQFAVRWTQAQPAVGAFIATLVPRHHDAEDILQRTAAALVGMRQNFDPSRSFVSWAMGVARVEVLRHRQETRREKAVFDTETIEAIAQSFERAEPNLSEMKSALDRCIEKLKGRAREVFELHYVQGLRPAEIAKQLARNTNAIFLALHRGRLSLRRCMERSMGGSEGLL